MNRSKICFVLPTLMQGGMERVVVELVNFYSSEGHDVSIICMFKTEILYDVNVAVKIYMPISGYKSSIYNKIILFKNLFYYLKKYARNGVVLGFGERFNSLTVVACKFLRIRVFISDRNNPLADNGNLNDKIRNIVYPFANGIIAQTKFSKAHFLKIKLNKNIKVISNPLKDIGDFPKNEEEKKTIITIGRLDAGKNHLELIDIFNKIGDFSWQLIIVGDGVLRKALNNKIEKLSLEKNVLLVGATSDVDYWLSKADIFAFTSLYEGFPNALNEAMAFPLACISYDCPAGPSEMINNGVNGFLIPLRDKKNYSEKLEFLMKNKIFRDKLKTQSLLVREKYNIKIIANQIFEFITM